MHNYSILKWYELSNITDVIGEIAVDRFKLFKQNAQIVLPKTTSNTPLIKPIESEKTSFVSNAEELSKKCNSLDELENMLKNFDGCSLKKTALNTFIGTGCKKNPLVFCIFDAPKAAADKSGNIFDGPHGTLMQKMLASIHLDNKNCYTTPLIPWRLPGDRKPTQTEELISLPFIKKQIEIVNPDFILIFGSIPTRTILGIESISKARQQKNFLNFCNKQIPVITTFGPDMVSTSQVSRKNAWDDLKKLSKLIQEKTSNKEEDK